MLTIIIANTLHGSAMCYFSFRSASKSARVSSTQNNKALLDMARIIVIVGHSFMKGVTMKVSFGYAQYLGGHSSLGKKRNGNILFTSEGIGIGSWNPKHAFISWEDVESIQIDGESVGKSKVGAVLAFGVLGLAAKGSKNQTAVTIHTKDDQTAYYLIDKVNYVNVLAKVQPLLKDADVPTHDKATMRGIDSLAKEEDVVEQIKKLAELKEQGILTQEEFTAKKRQLLNL